jgi:beta-phosphoglucomutase
MEIKAFLFDLDGVIVDTAVFHYKAWRKMAHGLGFDISEEFDEKLKGVSRMESLDIILAHGGLLCSQEEKELLAKQKNDHYLSLVSEMKPDAILPGILSLFDEISIYNETQIPANHIKIALGSVSKNAQLILERIGLLPKFDVIIDGNKISQGKPHPEVFLNGAKELGLPPTHCVVIEDAVAGVQAGKNAGMRVIGVGNTTTLKQADLVFPSLENIPLQALLSQLENIN